MRVVSDWSPRGMVGDFPGLFTPPLAGLSPTGGRVSSRGLCALFAFPFSFGELGCGGHAHFWPSIKPVTGHTVRVPPASLSEPGTRCPVNPVSGSFV